MEVVDKKGVIIQTGIATATHDFFLKNIIKGFKEVRVGVGGGKPPFKYIFLRVTKKEVIQVVRMNQMKVSFSITFNSRVRSHLPDILYIHKMTMKPIDMKQKIFNQ